MSFISVSLEKVHNFDNEDESLNTTFLNSQKGNTNNEDSEKKGGVR